MSTEGNFYFVSKNETYWDVIVSICEAAGFICYIELDKLVLTSPRILYEGTEGGASKQTAPFVWGINIKRLELYRNLGKKRRFNLLMRSFSKRDGKVLNVSIPKDTTEAWSKRTGISRAVQRISEIDTTGVTKKKPAPGFTFSFFEKTKEQLVFLGEKIFEEFTRQQLEGTLETREMQITDLGGLEFDVTKIKTGTPLKVEITSEDLKAILRKAPDGQSISTGQRQSYLLSRGYSLQAVEALIQAISSATGKIRPTFYTREVNFTFDSDGFKMRVGFVNFISLGETEAGGLISG